MPTELTEPDLSLLRGIKRADGEKLGPVHLQHFHKDDKDLYYIGTRHGTDIANVSHETIAQAITKYKPQCIILEGLETDKGFFPATRIDLKSTPQMQEALYTNSEENVHTAESLRKRHIPFIGGEPSVPAIFNAVERQGYTPKEIMGLYLVRHISQWRRRGILKDRDQFSEMATNFLKGEMFSHIKDDEKLTLNEFTAWYEKHKAEVGNKDYLQLVAKDSDPVYDADANYFQKMAGAVDATRDTNIIRTISKTLKQYDRVLVIYGNFHQFTSEPILEKMFGGRGTIENLTLSEPKPLEMAQPAIVPANAKTSDKAYPLFAAAAGIMGIASGAVILKAKGIAQKSFATMAAMGAIVTGGMMPHGL